MKKRLEKELSLSEIFERNDGFIRELLGHIYCDLVSRRGKKIECCYCNSKPDENGHYKCINPVYIPPEKICILGQA